MSKSRKSKKSDSSMPASGAGLVRYYDAELPGFKIGPYAIAAYVLFLIVIVITAGMIFPGG